MNPWQPARDSNAAPGNAFADEDTRDTPLDATYATHATAEALYAQEDDGRGSPSPSSTEPSKWTYPYHRGPGGALADD